MEYDRMEWCCKIKLYIDECGCLLKSTDHLELALGSHIRRYYNNFRYKYDLTPKKYLDRIKLLKIAEYVIKNGNSSLKGIDIYGEFGFNSDSAFYNFIRNNTGFRYQEYLKYVKKHKKSPPVPDKNIP